MKNQKKKEISRRKFIGATTTALVAAPTIITSNALGANGRPPASERIVMGTIGIGGRGRYDMGAFMTNKDVQMVAVCDVWKTRRDNAKNQVDKKYGNKDCSAYIDIHELLARQDIDAVLIATGDNWHSMASILAARAGKDIYCEKPSSVVIAESRAVTETMKRYSRIFQCGTQRRSIGHFAFAAHLAHSGKLGNLHTLHAEKAFPESGVHFEVLPEQPEPAREIMDWNRWLGPAAWRPYNAKYHQRGFWLRHGDFSGGSINEWGSHTVDLCQWANQTDHTGPIDYRIINEKKDVECVYANGTKLIIRKGLRFGTCPVRYEGDEGWVEVGDSGELETHPKSLLAERKFARGYPVDDHAREFLNSVKSRRQTSANADVAHHSITACHVANICVRLNRPVKWNPDKEEFVNDPEADRLRTRAMRQPWRL